MNKLSKLTALLLAIVLVLGVPMQVMAESLDTLPKYEAEVSRLLELLYDNMLAGATYEELLALTETMGRTDVVNFLERMIAEGVDDDMAEYDAHIAALFEEYMKSRVIPFTYAYTNVGPFLNYGTSAVESASTFALLSRAAVTESASNSTTGLNTTKSVTWDQDTNKGTITLEAFSTGATTLTQVTKCPPLDIILVMDQSSSMVNNNMAGEVTYTAITGNPNQNNTYYIQDGENWLVVDYCSRIRNGREQRCGAWTTGCEHLSLNGSYSGVQVDPSTTQFYQRIEEDGGTRREALIPAVQNFVKTITEKAEGDPTTTADNLNHRIAFVGYDATARIYTGVGVRKDVADGAAPTTEETANSFISVQDAAGQQLVKNMVADTRDERSYVFYSGSGTSTDYAINTALHILKNDTLADVDTDGNGQIDPYEKRARVVVVFTDGEPYRNGNQQQLANNGIGYAYTIKNTYGATVYSIGVLDGANPGAALPTGSGFDVNKFLHYVSSNFKTAQNLGSSTEAGSITAGYYLSATTTAELNNIFASIAGNIESAGGSSTTLTEETVVKDVLTNTFQLPQTATGGKTNVRVYIADIQDATTTPFTFKERVLVYGNDGTNNATNSAYAPTIEGNAISVKGFNFSENWCGTITDEKGNITTRAEGKKLIIEIDFEPVDGFLGGNDVETNVKDQSGIYKDQESADKNDPVIQLPDPPNVDVKLWKIQVIGKHQHIFLSNEADVNALLQSFSLQYTKEGSPDETYTVNGIRNDYATLKFTLATRENYQMIYTIEPGATVGTWTYVDGNNGDPIENFDVTPFLTNDAEYRISYDVIPIPKTDGTTGVAATTGFLDVGVHVYKPTFTFRDTTEKYLSDETAENYYKLNNYVSESWSHKYYNEITVTINVAYDENGTPSYSYVVTSNKEGVDPIYSPAGWDLSQTIDFSGYGSTEGKTYKVTMSGPKPDVAFTYSPVETKWIQDGKVTAVECVPVDVTKVTLTSTNTHDKVEQGEGGVVTEGEYQTRSVYTEGSDSASVTITKLEEGATPTPKTVTDIPHIKTLRNELDCNCSYDAQEGGVTDIHANAPETGAVPEFVIHITDVSGDLRIGKRVEPDNAPADAVFTFTLTLTDTAGKALTGEYVAIPETMTTATDEDGNEITSFVQGDPQTIKLDTNGSCTFTLQDGEHLLIKDLPAQTKYTVTETDAQGYTTFVAVDYDANRTPAKTAEGTVVSGDVTTVRFINVVQGTLLVIKQVEGVDVPDDEFRFTIELEHDDLPEEYSYEYNKYPTVLEEGQTLTPTETGYITPDKNTFTLKKDECIQILGLLAGTTYTVTETANDAYVTRVVNGPLSTASSDASATGTIPAAATERATFFNTYQYAPLTIQKVVTGNAASADDTFLFTVTGTGITDKMQVILKAGETVTINDLPLGTYKVTEETAWSWRYNLDSVTCGDVATTNGAEHQLDPSGLSYVFTNSVDNQQWLDGNAHADNNFTGTTTTEGGGK